MPHDISKRNDNTNLSIKYGDKEINANGNKSLIAMVTSAAMVTI